MRRVSYWFIWGLFLNLPPTTFASAIVFSNLQDNSIPCGCQPGSGLLVGTFTYAPLQHTMLGNGFTVSATGDYALESIFVPILIAEGSRNSLLLSLYTAAADGSPGRPIEEFRIENRMETLNVLDIRFYGLSIDSVLHPTLQAGTLYWLVASTSWTDSGLVWFSNNAGDTGPVGLKINDYPFGFRDDIRAAFAVYGTPLQVVPEPSSSALMELGLLTIAFATPICAVLKHLGCRLHGRRRSNARRTQS